MKKKPTNQEMPQDQKPLTDQEIKDIMVNNMTIDNNESSKVVITDRLEIDYMLKSIISESKRKASVTVVIFERLQRVANSRSITVDEQLKLAKLMNGLILSYPFQELLKKELDKKKSSDKKVRTGKYKKPGHLQDQILKYDYPKDKKPDIYSVLDEKTKSKIETRGVKRSEVVEGIRLTPSETKAVDTLCKLLHHNSQNLDPKKSKYYTGNKEPEIVRNGDEKAPAPKLSFTLYKFTKEYLGDDKIGGSDVKDVARILKGLEKREFLIKYKEEIPLDNGGKRIRELEMFDKIVRLPTLRETDIDKQGIEVSKREETIITLHPIFRSQINSKFILVPDDINKRTALAYGSSNVSQVTLKLRDYLMTELSSKHYNPEIGQDRLYFKLAEKWMRRSRKSMVKRYVDKALKVVEELGLLQSYDIKTAKGTGEPKIVFKLNKDFE